MQALWPGDFVRWQRVARSRAVPFGQTVDIRCVDFQHLARRPAPPINPKQIARDLYQFDFVFCLRDDPVVRELLDSARVPSPFAAGDDLTHETARQKRAVVEVIGPYSRTGLFAELPIHWPTASQNLGLCVAAGFPTNKWPNACWLDLASRLGRQGLFVTLIGGPGERDDLRLLSRLLPHVPHTVVQGGDDLGEFLDALDGVDLIVGSDGGTVHICSLRKPICSIFGSSPWRRYAPFGHDNVLITRDEVCSPCVQFSPDTVNGCLTRECMAAMDLGWSSALPCPTGAIFVGSVARASSAALVIAKHTDSGKATRNFLPSHFRTFDHRPRSKQWRGAGLGLARR